MNDRGATATASDEGLVALARAGDRGAFAALWRRHAASGLKVARQFTSSIDPDDLVAEAYTSIYRQVLAGGGPDGAFRPYLYTTIRNLANRWGRSMRDVSVEDIDEFEDPAAYDDPVTVALDRTLTARAFRNLPERWQAVLWYTEVEGMDPHEVAPILGISANSVAALSYRAREGLRKAWLQAHVSDARLAGECRWALDHLGEHARHGLSPRDADRLDRHLASCTKCSIVAEEVDEVGSRLALVLLPLLLGGTAGGAWLTMAGAPASASAATLAAPAMPPAFDVVVSGVSGAVVAGLSAAATPALVGALALAIAVSGGLAAGIVSSEAPPPRGISVAQPLQPEQASATIPSVRAVPDAPEPDAEAVPGESPASGPARAVGPLVDTVSEAVAPVTDILGTVTDPVAGLADGVIAPVAGLADGVTDAITPITGIVTDAIAPVTGIVTDVSDPINAILPVAPVLDQTAGEVSDAIAPGALSDTLRTAFGLLR